MSSIDQETLNKFISNIIRTGDAERIDASLRQLLSILEVNGIDSAYQQQVQNCILAAPELAEMGIQLGRAKDITEEDLVIMEQRYQARRKREMEAALHARC